MLGLRRLICVGISDKGAFEPLKQRMADWGVLFAQGIHEANSFLRRLDVSVGIIVVSNAAEDGVNDVAALLNAHCDIQWIGVFPAKICETAAWRDLIVDSLVLLCHKRLDWFCRPQHGHRASRTLNWKLSR